MGNRKIAKWRNSEIAKWRNGEIKMTDNENFYTYNSESGGWEWKGKKAEKSTRD
jgi:hypothetical protein